MSTTNIFAELIVIGLGAFASLFLLVTAVLGLNKEAVALLMSSPVAAIPALAFIYLFGIVTDRVSDCLFSSLERREDNKGGVSDPDYYQTKTRALASSEHFFRLYEHNRSRQRICRGWVVNGMALLITGNTFIALRGSEFASVDWGLVSLAGSLLLLFLIAACWFSWKCLRRSELDRMGDQARLAT